MPKLTQDQLNAAHSIDKSIAVIAGAGSGKTTVLIERCKHIIGDNPEKLSNMLIITFTEKAAKELKNRLQKILPETHHHHLDNAWIGTFHSCCARILREHSPLIGIQPSFEILDESSIRLLNTRLITHTLLTLMKNDDPSTQAMLDQLSFKKVAMLMDELMQFRWHASQEIMINNDDSDDNDIRHHCKNIFSKTYSALNSKLLERQAMDFQALEINTLTLFKKYPEITKKYQHLFQHILVDEFQDTNDIQYSFITHLFKNNVNTLCIVGDPRQSIYRFRGANAHCFHKGLNLILQNNGKIIELSDNFRSAIGIVDYVNLFQKDHVEPLFGQSASYITSSKTGMKAFNTNSKTTPPVVHLKITMDEKQSSQYRRHHEAHAIAVYIKKLVSMNYNYSDITCLFQALTSTHIYEHVFKEHQIPYRISGGAGILNHEEICDIILILEYAANPDNVIALLGLIRSPLIGLSDNEIVILAGKDGKQLKKSIQNNPRLFILEKISRYAAIMRPSELIRYTLSETGYELICNAIDSSFSKSAAIERFLGFIEYHEDKNNLSLTALIEFINNLKDKDARISNPPVSSESSNSIHLMTVHAAKGLEFPIVILPELFRNQHNTGGDWQYVRNHGIGFKLQHPERPFGKRVESLTYKELHCTDKEENCAEIIRLLYVAMTRARESLVLPVYDQIKRSGLWHKSISALEANIIEKEYYQPQAASDTKILTPNIHFKNTVDNPLKKFKPQSFSVSQLECFFRCPHEYYLRYELGMPESLPQPRNSQFEKKSKIPANVFGSIIHSCAQHFNGKWHNDMNNHIAMACNDLQVIADKQLVLEIKKLFQQTESLSISNMWQWSDGYREVPFQWNFNDTFINGSIDWLIVDNDEHIHIVDFKTDRIDKTQVHEKAAEYNMQMICYALALHHALNQPIAETVLVFLHAQYVVHTAFSANWQAHSEKMVSDIITKIHDKNFTTTIENKPCKRCRYAHNKFCQLGTCP